MSQINITIQCAPGQLGEVLESIRRGFASADPRPSAISALTQYTGDPLTLNTEAFLNSAKEVVREVTGVDHLSLGEAPADSEGALAEAKKRTRRTKAQIAEDNARQAQIDEARKQSIAEGSPSTRTLMDAAANPPETTAAHDITSSLFSVGETTPPVSPTVQTAAQTGGGAQEVTFETLQNFVVKLGKDYKVAFPKITEVLAKHTSAAGVSSARELSGVQRGAAFAELRTLHEGATP